MASATYEVEQQENGVVVVKKNGKVAAIKYNLPAAQSWVQFDNLRDQVNQAIRNM